MRVIRWDLMKERAQEEFLHRFDPGYGFPTGATFLALIESFTNPAGPRKPLAVMEEWKTYALSLIDRWDIRCCMKLAELFPGCLPKHLRGRMPACAYDDKGHWVLTFD